MPDKLLDGLHLVIPQGSFFGLIGPNGAGKTTLIGAAAGLVTIPSGHLRVFGRDVVSESSAARQLLGLAPQEVHLDRFLTSREGLVYHGRYFGMTKKEAQARASELLAIFDLSDKTGVRPNRLSGGMRRRLLIARALMHRPRLVVLDEPTAGVDLELRNELWRYLRRLHQEEDATILLTTHYIEEAETLCERIAFIRGGRIVAEGSPAELRAAYRGRRLEDVYYTLMGRDVEPTRATPGAGLEIDACLTTEACQTAEGGPQTPAEAPTTHAPATETPAPHAPPAPHGSGIARSPSPGAIGSHPDPETIVLREPVLVQRRGTIALAGREVRRVLSLWTQTILPPVLMALLYLLVFGGALGARVRQLEGVDYLSFIFPGLVVMTVAGQAFANSATSLFQAKYEGHIEDVLSSPIAAWRMTLAYMVGGLVRSGIAATVLIVIAVPFTDPIHDPWLALASLALTGVLFAALGVVTGIWAETFDQFSFVANLVIAPLALVAGVFYSVRALSGIWAVLTRLDPIYYLVAAARRGFVGIEEEPVALSLVVASAVGLGLISLGTWMLARGWRLKP
ncbi:MAG: ATP-binding cassette domain-containing protein [Actinobacteria bacterium]|nr:ATP-binding cassette domain-containing protein [Actinomycetota bacterium]